MQWLKEIRHDSYFLSLLQKHKHTLTYGISLAVLMFLLKWLELRFIIIDHAFEIYIGSLALLFTALGSWLALRLTKPRVKTVVIEKTVPVVHTDFAFNEAEVKKRGLSSRELDVLQLMAEGLSNRQIASRLFLSENTVKTHSSNLFEKMEVQRRTQAVDKARKLNIIP